MPATLDQVAALALALPEVTEGTSRGWRTWNVRKRMFVWEREFSKADVARFGDQPVPPGPIIGVRVADLVEKDAVLAAGIKGVFTIPHFEGYAAVLVQLRAVGKRDLRELVTDAWLACAPQTLVKAFVDPAGRR